jgi:hypothetical protein
MIDFKNLKFVVASPGRCGSVFTTMVLCKSLNLLPLFTNNTERIVTNKPFVMHLHDATWLIPDHVRIVCPRRRNLLKETLSAVISEQFQEWNNYTGQHSPFLADIEMFEIKYIWHKKWFKAFDHYQKNQDKTFIYFEDFIGNSENLCGLLNIPTVTIQSQKSPYDPYQYILNIKELEKKFLELEQDQKLQNTPIDCFDWSDKKNVYTRFDQDH